MSHEDAVEGSERSTTPIVRPSTDFRPDPQKVGLVAAERRREPEGARGEEPSTGGDPSTGEASATPGSDATAKGPDAREDSGEAREGDAAAPGTHPEPAHELGSIEENIETLMAESFRDAAEHLEEKLLGGQRVLHRRELAQLAGISRASSRKIWRALGFSRVYDVDVAFTLDDARGLKALATLVRDGTVDEETALALARGLGHTTDRLAVWQMETLVEYLTDERGLSDADARREVLAELEGLLAPLEQLLVYAWRRNLAGVLGRLAVNVDQSLQVEHPGGRSDVEMPLGRAVGFVDLVSYTRLSQRLEPRELARLVQRFQNRAHTVVTAAGGRVIKTVGDEVFYSAETPAMGAQIALSLAEQIRRDPELPQARGAVVWGRVLSRLGDIFGSTVNLAARLTAIAQPGTVITDPHTHDVLAESDTWDLVALDPVTLQGIGEITPFELRRGTEAPLVLDDEDEDDAAFRPIDQNS